MLAQWNYIEGVRQSIIEHDYKLTNHVFGSRFPYDRRYRIYAIAGTIGGRFDRTYGIVGSFEFLIETVYRRDTKDGNKLVPTKFRIYPCLQHLQEMRNVYIELEVPNE